MLSCSETLVHVASHHRLIVDPHEAFVGGSWVALRRNSKRASFTFPRIAMTMRLAKGLSHPQHPPRMSHILLKKVVKNTFHQPQRAQNSESQRFVGWLKGEKRESGHTWEQHLRRAHGLDAGLQNLFETLHRLASCHHLV